MKNATFSVIMPTCGRPSLETSVRSYVAQQRMLGDQLFVVVDAHCEDPEDRFQFCENAITKADGWGKGVRISRYDSGYNWLGVEQINYCWRTQPVNGSHILLLGDDDCYTQYAFTILRAACNSFPGCPILFKFVAPYDIRMVLWDQPRLEKSKISGCCIALPRQYMLEHSTEKYVEHDYDWIIATCGNATADGHHPKWIDSVLVVARPDEETEKLWPIAR